MNLGQLEYLIETVKHGSFAKAAQNLYVTPQAISKSIGELEKELSVTLLEKSGRGITPTSLAVQLALRAKEPLQAFNEFTQFAESQSRGDTDFGSISLGIASTQYRGEFYTLPDFDTFLKQYPRIALKPMLFSNESCMAALQQGIIDAAILLGQIDQPGFTNRKLLSFVPQLAVSKKFFPVSGAELALKQLNGLTVAMPSDIRFTYSKFKAKLDEQNISVQFENIPPSMKSQRNFINSGGAILVAEHAELVGLFPEIEAIPFIDEDRFSLSIYLAYPDKHDPSPMPKLETYLRSTSRRISKHI